MNAKNLLVGVIAAGTVFGISTPSVQAFEWGRMMEQVMPGKMSDTMGMGGMGQMAMSDAMKSLMEELRTAQKAGNVENIKVVREKIKAQRDADRKVQQAAMETAIAGGYETWKAFVEKQDMPMMVGMTKNITAENFSTFVEFHNAKKKVMELSEKLGMGMGGMMGNMSGGMMGDMAGKGCKMMEEMGNRGKNMGQKMKGLRGSGRMPYNMEQ